MLNSYYSLQHGRAIDLNSHHYSTNFGLDLLMVGTVNITTFDPCVLINKNTNTYLAIYIDNLTFFQPPSMEGIIASIKTESEVIHRL